MQQRCWKTLTLSYFGKYTVHCPLMRIILRAVQYYRGSLCHSLAVNALWQVNSVLKCFWCRANLTDISRVILKLCLNWRCDVCVMAALPLSVKSQVIIMNDLFLLYNHVALLLDSQMLATLVWHPIGTRMRWPLTRLPLRWTKTCLIKSIVFRAMELLNSIIYGFRCTRPSLLRYVGRYFGHRPTWFDVPTKNALHPFWVALKKK